MISDLDHRWNQLEKDYDGKLVYTRLDLDRENGIRIALVGRERKRSILIEMDPSEEIAPTPPRWRGLDFDTISLDDGREGAFMNVILSEESPEYRGIFNVLCSDIIRTLEQTEATSRIRGLAICLERWNRFFERWEAGGLSPWRQRGLYGELYMIHMLLDRGLSPSDAVSSWKGCCGEDQDFLRNGRAVEVKTTVTKEPRTVTISSERQLDDRNLESLVLLVLTLHKMDDYAWSLRDLVREIRQRISCVVNASYTFESGLISSGYLDLDDPSYGQGYGIRQIEAFSVGTGFPRITEIPPGTGDIRYSLTLSACGPYTIDIGIMLDRFIGGESDE